ncbi:hypothetical protein C8P70_10351 [Myroides indicus]|uniref:Uncharacterized protein n=1 Tax=Myroides indicus TaxID=1323422 RepID=A0A4R7F803_9FLAO|nr:hypothetical protein C8P70_10351 [Myroides indicus]
MKVFTSLILFVVILMFLSYQESIRSNLNEHSIVIEEVEKRDSLPINSYKDVVQKEIECCI